MTYAYYERGTYTDTRRRYNVHSYRIRTYNANVIVTDATDEYEI